MKEHDGQLFSFSLFFPLRVFYVLVLAIYTWFQAHGALHTCLYHWCLFGSLSSSLHGFLYFLRVLGFNDMNELWFLVTCSSLVFVCFVSFSLSSGVQVVLLLDIRSIVN